MRASIKFPEPREVDVLKLTTNNKLIGRTFKRDQKVVKQSLEELDVEAGMAMEAKLEGGQHY